MSTIALFLIALAGPAFAETPVPTATQTTESAAPAQAVSLVAGGSAGVQAPDFTVTDSTGAEVSLAALRAKGPVVLVFYRGHW